MCTYLIRTTVDNALQASTETTGLSPPSLPTTVIGLLDHKEWPAQVSLKTVPLRGYITSFHSGGHRNSL